MMDEMAFLKVSKLVSILLEIDFWIIIIAERPKRYLERKVATDRTIDGQLVYLV